MAVLSWSGSSVPIRKMWPEASSSSTASNPHTLYIHPPWIHELRTWCTPTTSESGIALCGFPSPNVAVTLPSATVTASLLNQNVMATMETTNARIRRPTHADSSSSDTDRSVDQATAAMNTVVRIPV